MSTDAMSSQVPSVKDNSNPGDALPDDSSNNVQDVLAQKTLAMLGGAPQSEVDRLDGETRTRLARMGAGSAIDADGAEPGNGGAGDAGATDPAEQTGSDASVAQDARSANLAAQSPTLAQREQELAELERRLDTAGAHEGLWNPEIAGLVKEHGRAAAALEVARLGAKQEAAELQQLAANRDRVLGETMQRYPDLGNRDSALWKVAAQMAREAHDPAHPDHVAGQQGDAPRYFAEKAAELLRLKPVSNGPVIATGPRAGGRPGPVSGSRQTLLPSPQASARDQAESAQARTLAMIGGQSGAGDDPESAVLVL